MARDKFGFDPKETTSIRDNPFWDDTDVAHPAYWRGEYAGEQAVINRILKVLDGKDDGKGVLGDKGLEEIRRRILQLMNKKK